MAIGRVRRIRVSASTGLSESQEYGVPGGRAAVDAHVAVLEHLRAGIGEGRQRPLRHDVEPGTGDPLSGVVDAEMEISKFGRQGLHELLVGPLQADVDDVGDPELDQFGQLADRQRLVVGVEVAADGDPVSNEVSVREALGCLSDGMVSSSVGAPRGSGAHSPDRRGGGILNRPPDLAEMWVLPETVG